MLVVAPFLRTVAEFGVHRSLGQHVRQPHAGARKPSQQTRYLQTHAGHLLLTKIKSTMKGNGRGRQSLLRICGGPFPIFLVKFDVRIVVCTGCTGTLPDAPDLSQKDCQEPGRRECEFHLSPLAQKTSFLQNIVVIE